MHLRRHPSLTGCFVAGGRSCSARPERVRMECLECVPREPVPRVCAPSKYPNRVHRSLRWCAPMVFLEFFRPHAPSAC